MRLSVPVVLAALFVASDARSDQAADGRFLVTENDDEIRIATSEWEAAIRKRGYVSGVAGGSFLDKKTGFRDAGHGLDIVNFIMAPGSDEAYRDQLSDQLTYQFNSLVHGNRAKRLLEGPQICTRAREVSPEVIRGREFLAVKMGYKYRLAAPGLRTGSRWTQTIVFPAGKRYFISSDRINAVNSNDAMFLRIDLPGHIKHRRGDTFSEIYLSYHGRIPAEEFFQDFAPDARFNYRRGAAGNKPPQRFIRAYRLKDAESGRIGPWLAGMTLDPSCVYEAWCHQRGYVCLIEEIGGWPVRAGESFSAAYVIGYFDSIEEMHAVYDRYAGHRGLQVDASQWRLTP